ncbi:hypothetical protein HCU40_01740 [Pseudanabaena biceps]|nr:hypothetical protein [Pseudanabaena biceps]
MIATTSPKLEAKPKVTWQKLPEDFVLPDDPVDNNLQPLLAAALRESLELANLILESMLIATNFGICANVGDKTVVKAPDWVYVRSVKSTSARSEIRRSYTPHLEGDLPAIVLEFISETEGGEYSINPHYPYGKWHFYEQILSIPIYGIFHPKTGTLDLYRLVNGKYEQQLPDTQKRFWIDEMNMFIGVWEGKKSGFTTNWLRWWDQSGNLLLWGSEIIEQVRQRAEQDHQRAEQERQRAEQAELQLQQEQAIRQRMADKLKALGIDQELI